MNSNQQWLQPSQNNSPYRNNYHINPAESKIVYKSLENKTQTNQVKVMSPQGQYYQNYPNKNMTNVVYQQKRVASLSPQGEPQRIYQQNLNVNVHNPNAVQNNRLQSPNQVTINQLAYSSNPVQAQNVAMNQNYLIPTNNTLVNQAYQKTSPIPQGHNMLHSHQYSQPLGYLHLQHQTSTPVIASSTQINNNLQPSIPSVPMMSSTASNITFSYQKGMPNNQMQTSITQTRKTDMYASYPSKPQSLIQSGVPNILNSGININLDNGNISNQKTYHLSSIHLKQTQSHVPVVPRVATNPYASQAVPSNINTSTKQAKFHMTHSIQYQPLGHQSHHRHVHHVQQEEHSSIIIGKTSSKINHPTTPVAQLQQINQVPNGPSHLYINNTNKVQNSSHHNSQHPPAQSVLQQTQIQHQPNTIQAYSDHHQYQQNLNPNPNQPIIQNTDQTSNPPQSSSHPIWQQRFIMIYQKFQWFYQRYDFISRQFTILSQQFQNVNSQDQWLELKQKHDLLLEKIQQIQQELANTIHQNQELAEQYELQNRNSKESDQGQRVWEHRYHQLLEQYKSLSQNYADLQSQGNNNNMNTSQSQHSQNRQANLLTPEQQLQLQSKFQQLQQQYNILCQEYQKIRIQYEKTYQQNTQFNKQNTQLIANYQQARNMSNQLQAYVQQLQHENDHLKKQQRKSLPQTDINQQNLNMVPRQEVQKMEYQFNQELQRYQEQLQKYQIRFQQYEEQQEGYRQQLQKISEIAMQRQNRIKELQASPNNAFINNNGGQSKSGHSQQPGSQQGPQWQKTYINRLEHEIKQFRQKQKELLHKLEIKDLQRRSLDDKIRYLEKQLQIKNQQCQKLGRNLDEKLVKIQQNTTYLGTKVQGSRHIVQQQVTRPNLTTNSQYQSQIHHLQSQIHQLQSILNSKGGHQKDLQDQISQYEQQFRKQTSIQNVSEIQYQKKLSQIQIQSARKIAQKEMKITVMKSEIQRLQDVAEKYKKEVEAAKVGLGKEYQQKEKFLIEKYQTRIAQSNEKIQQKVSELSLTKQKLSRYEIQIRRKTDQLSQIKGFLNNSKLRSPTNSNSRNQLTLLKQQLKVKQQALQRKTQQLNKIKKQKQYKQKHILQLQSQVEQLNSEVSKKRSEISTLKRQLNDMQSLQSEYDTLKNNYSKKMQEINQFREELFEMQKVKMLYETNQRQLERFININKQKSDQILKLKDFIDELEKKLSNANHGKNKYQINSPTNAGNNRSTIYQQFQGTSSVRKSPFQSLGYSQQQITQLRQLIKKKDQQIQRSTQSYQQIQYSLQTKTRQIQLQKSQHSALLRSKQSEISTLNHTILSLQTRLKQSQSKRLKLTQQISSMKQNFQSQLKQDSTRHKNYYEKIISRHQDDYRQQKDKLRANQQLINHQQIQLQKNKTLIKSLQIQLKQQTKKLNNQQALQLQKQQFVSTFRQKHAQSQQSMKSLYEKISALELQLKTKDQQLKLSQEKNGILEQKIKKNKKEYENFRNKLIIGQQYENNNSVVQYLSKRIAQYESKMINQSEHDFGFKIKDSQANHVFENQVVYQLKMQNDLLRKQLEGKGIQYDRKILNQLEQENLKRSKNLLKNSTFSSKINNLSSQYMMKDNIEDVNFYKQKNKQLQKLVQNHLTVNKELKSKIENLIKGSTSNASKQLDYYKEQINQYEHKISQLEKKIQVLTQQNRTISKGMSKRQSRVEGNYEERVKQLEGKLTQSIKQVQQLTQEKTELQISRSELQMQKKMLSDEIKRLNQKISTFTQSKSERYEEQSKQLRQKCQQYESQITKLLNRAKVLQSQIQRLNQVNASSKQSLADLNSLKLKINQLSQQLARSENALHEEQLKSSSLVSEIVSWQQKSKFFQNQIQRLKQINQLYLKKQKSTDLSQSSVLKQSTSNLQIQISSLQSQILTLQSQITSINQQKSHQYQIIQDLNSQVQYYRKIIFSLQYNLEMIRSNVLEEEALLEEVLLGRENVESGIQGLKVNIQRNLEAVNQVFKKVKTA